MCSVGVEIQRLCLGLGVNPNIFLQQETTSKSRFFGFSLDMGIDLTSNQNGTRGGVSKNNKRFEKSDSGRVHWTETNVSGYL